MSVIDRGPGAPCAPTPEPLLREATRLCAELAGGAVCAPPGPVRLADRFRGAVLGDPMAQLVAHRRALASGAARVIALLRFARFLEGRGLDELATVPWSELARLCPDDPAPAVSLARLFLARGRRTDRTTAERLRDYDRVFRYARRALAHLSDPHPVSDWMRSAGAEVTLLKGQYAMH